MLIHIKRETNNKYRNKVLVNPYWQEADQLAIYTVQVRILTQGNQEKI